MRTFKQVGPLGRKTETAFVDLVAGLILVGYGAALAPFVKGVLTSGVF
ncbi:MAG: hypothetical protein ACE5EM_01115 [Sphingomonadales bacterium]